MKDNKTNKTTELYISKAHTKYINLLHYFFLPFFALSLTGAPSPSKFLDGCQLSGFLRYIGHGGMVS